MSKILETLEKTLIIPIKQNEQMSMHTSVKIGGPAEYYVAVDKIDYLIKAVKIGRELGLRVFVFGGGSNIIVSDSGIKGLVIKNNCRKFDIASMKGTIKSGAMDVSYALVSAEAGVLMNQLVRFTIEQGLSGLEYSLGLPGTVGGAVAMNANYPKRNVFVGDAVHRVLVLREDNEVLELDRDALGFSSGRSALQDTENIILSVIFRLTPSDKTVLWERGTEAVTYRNETGPKGVTSGCTFRNIGLSSAMRIPTPGHTTSPDYLIERAGLKGKRVGDAVVSESNPNYILNMGQATAHDVLELVKLVTSEVHKKFGVQLSMEVKVIGEEKFV